MLLLVFMFIVPLSQSLDLYYEVPDRNISHCSRKLSVSSEVGCSSKYPNSNGIVLISENASSILDFLRESSNSYIIVVPLKLFVDKNLTSIFRRSQNIAGMFVFSPNFPSYAQFSPPAFSENTLCPNGNFNFYNDTGRLCNVKPEWNPPASNYAKMYWPFPVVHASSSEVDIWKQVRKCYTTWNEEPVDDTRCFMEIRNFMTAVNSTQTCYNRELLLRYRLEQTAEFCRELGGVNLVMRSRNLTSNSDRSEPSPTVVVLTRIDSMSMFDRRATSGFSVLPAVSVLLSVAAHLMNQPTFKNGKLRKNVLFAFLDNEALEFMGSQRLFFDLTNGRLGQASGSPFTAKSIESVIELAGIGLPANDSIDSKSIYYLLSDPKIVNETLNVTAGVWNKLNDSAKGIIFVNGSVNGSEHLLLPPSVSIQRLLSYFGQLGIPLSHTVISDRPGKSPYSDEWMDSFLDNHWPLEPKSNQRLLQLANSLADALYREALGTVEPMPEPIKDVTPGELMDCFLSNPGCKLLRMHLEPAIINFLMSLDGPIPMQTYDPVEGYSWRLSHVVARLLMGLTGDRLAECPPRSDYGAFTYMYGYYNGSNWCYRSLIETSTAFFFLEGDKVASPGWVRSGLYQDKRHVRLFRSSSISNDIVSLVLGIILTTLTCVLTLVFRHFATQIFTTPSVHSLATQPTSVSL